jgi:hypothetical protein
LIRHWCARNQITLRESSIFSSLRKAQNLDLSRGLVKISASCFSVLTWWILISPLTSWSLKAQNLDHLDWIWFWEKFLLCCSSISEGPVLLPVLKSAGLKARTRGYGIAYRRVRYWTLRKSSLLSILWAFLYFFPFLLPAFFCCLSSTSSHREVFWSMWVLRDWNWDNGLNWNKIGLGSHSPLSGCFAQSVNLCTRMHLCLFSLHYGLRLHNSLTGCIWTNKSRTWNLS